MLDSKKYICRQIQPEEVKLFQHAWNKRKPLFKGARSAFNLNQKEFSSEIIEKKLSKDKIVLGIFKENQIFSSVSIYPWPRSPYYTMYDFFITENSPIKFYDAAEVLFSNAFKIMEPRGYFTFYVVTYFRSFQITEFINTGSLKKIIGNIPVFSRYHVFIEDFLLSGKKSKYDSINDLLRNNIWDCPVLIRKGVLKNKYSVDYFKNKLLNNS